MDSKISTPITHAQLVDAARRWLGKKCAVITTELVSAGETADALGWHGHGHSILIECKSSIADFRADQQKFQRRNPEKGMGQIRYYLAPTGLLDVTKLPSRWGLLEFDGKRVCEKVKAGCHPEYCWRGEMGCLQSVIRRIGSTSIVKGVSIKCYTIPTKCKATLTVEPETIDIGD